MKEKNTIGAEALANNRTQAGTRLREVRVRFWRGSNQVFFSLFIIFLLIIFPKATYAETLRISPVVLKIGLSPGKTTEQNITIDNLLNVPLPIKATVEGFDASDEENGIKVTNEVVTSPLTSWMKLDTEDAIIPALSSQVFKATITVPSEVPLGGYYAVIFFTPIISPLDQSNNNQIGAKIGALALANIGVTNKNNEAEIPNFDFNKSFYQTDSPKVILRVKNTSLNFFTAKPQIKIKPLFGQEQIIDWEEKTLLPGKVRRWEKTIDLQNHYGFLYQASLQVSLENGQYATAQKIFFGFPFQQTALYIIFALILLYSLFHLKRIKKAVKLLFKPE